ncbi:prepilin-type cleavage/methylation domain-containing protein, partial [Campylobacter coli]|nr:prepilin-type cleavage/methylation domain-containing protein [Campylobacter coli]
NEASKNDIINIANNPKQEIQNLDFTINSKNKASVAQSKNENIKNLAIKTYLLIVGL